MFELLDNVYLGNTVQDYLLAVLIILIGLFVVFVVKKFLLNRLTHLADTRDNQFFRFLTRDLPRSFMLVLYFSVVSFGIKNLVIHDLLNRTLNILGLILLTVCIILFALRFVEFLIQRSQQRLSEDESNSRLTVLKPVITVIVWGVGLVFLLDNLGFKISAVVAGLGIGGIAIALAAQAVLGDLFSYFAILFDKPFKLGDFVIVGDYLGVIEHIGIKTTRIRSLNGEQLVFSNTDLTSSRLRNFKKMEERRVLFKLGVTYQTPKVKVAEIPQVIHAIIQNIEHTRFDRAHFASFGNFSLEFEIVYYIMGADYNKYMDIQQQINLAIMDEFEHRGIEFAYPTQTLFLQRSQNGAELKKTEAYQHPSEPP